jgi:hypothetical protein
MRRSDGMMKHTTHAFLYNPLLLTALSRVVSASTDRSRNLGAAIWKHDGRETSTLITIHLRLMCAAGGWCFPPPSPRSPLVSNRRQRSSFRWSIGLITLRPRRSSTIDIPRPSFRQVLEKLRLVVSSALTTEGGVTHVMTASENLMSSPHGPFYPLCCAID